MLLLFFLEKLCSEYWNSIFIYSTTHFRGKHIKLFRHDNVDDGTYFAGNSLVQYKVVICNMYTVSHTLTKTLLTSPVKMDFHVNLLLSVIQTFNMCMLAGMNLWMRDDMRAESKGGTQPL